MAVIYLLTQSGGEYEDHWTRNLGAYEDEDQAMAEHARLVADAQEKEKFAARIENWYAKWLIAHPHPEMSDEDADLDWDAPEFQAVWDRHQVRCEAHSDLWYKSYLLYARAWKFTPAPKEDYNAIHGRYEYANFRVQPLEFHPKGNK